MIAEVFIKKIDWFDETAEEADVCFTYKGQDYWAFSHPCSFVENRVYKVKIFPLIITYIEDDIFWNLNADTKYKKIVQNGDYRTNYLCYGKIVSNSPIVVDYGGLEFQYGDGFRARDIGVVGKYIYHVFDRLDIDVSE